MQSIAQISLLVADYDEALEFYTKKLNFDVIEDTELTNENKRWVVVRPPGSAGAKLLLAKASDDSQMSLIGKQSGGRVMLFLETSDFWRDYEAYKEKGIEFVRQPQENSYGTVAVFTDIYGNLWDLIQNT